MTVSPSLSDPAWFPDRIDWANGLIRLIHVARSRIVDSAFLDGRTPLTCGDAPDAVIELDRFVAEVPPCREPLRWLFHAGFCGSTLLARGLTIEDRLLCLREPQVLIDLCDWRLAAEPAQLPRYRAVLAAVTAKLGQRWRTDEAVAIKPSNWPNPIVDDLWDRERHDRAMIVRIGAEPFLVAVLRGGRARIDFVLGFYRHLAKARPGLAQQARAATRASGDPLSDSLQIVAATHWVQDHILDDACRAAGTSLDRCAIAYPDWLGDPVGTADQVVTLLALDVTPDALAQSLAAQRSGHSKQAELGFEPDMEAEANRAIRQRYAAQIDSALAMLDRID